MTYVRMDKKKKEKEKKENYTYTRINTFCLLRSIEVKKKKK